MKEVMSQENKARYGWDSTCQGGLEGWCYKESANTTAPLPLPNNSIQRWSSFREVWQELDLLESQEKHHKEKKDKTQERDYVCFAKDFSRNPYTFPFQSASNEPSYQHTTGTTHVVPELYSLRSQIKIQWRWASSMNPGRVFLSGRDDEAGVIKAVRVRAARAETTAGPAGAAMRKKKEHGYPCPECGKVFRRPSALRTHSIIHIGKSPYVCQLPGCAKRFNVKSNLLRHVKSHYSRGGAHGPL